MKVFIVNDRVFPIFFFTFCCFERGGVTPGFMDWLHSSIDANQVGAFAYLNGKQKIQLLFSTMETKQSNIFSSLNFSIKKKL